MFGLFLRKCICLLFCDVQGKFVTELRDFFGSALRHINTLEMHSCVSVSVGVTGKSMYQNQGISTFDQKHVN